MQRLLLYNKDLQVLTGKSKKACYRLMAKIRLKSGKDPDVPITLYEFSDYIRIGVDIIQMLLRRRQPI